MLREHGSFVRKLKGSQRGAIVQIQQSKGQRFGRVITFLKIKICSMIRKGERMALKQDFIALACALDLFVGSECVALLCINLSQPPRHLGIIRVNNREQ